MTPCGSPTHACCLDLPRDGTKSRSFSTTALYSESGRRGARERQTVCSLHPLGDQDVTHLDRVARGLHDTRGGPGAYSDRLTRLQKMPSHHLCEGLCEECSKDIDTTTTTIPPPAPKDLCGCECPSVPQDRPPVPPVASQQPPARPNPRIPTSDYESSDSPSSVDTSEEALGGRSARLAEIAAPAAVVEEKEEEVEVMGRESPLPPPTTATTTTTTHAHDQVCLCTYVYVCVCVY